MRFCARAATVRDRHCYRRTKRCRGERDYGVWTQQETRSGCSFSHTFARHSSTLHYSTNGRHETRDAQPTGNRNFHERAYICRFFIGDDAHMRESAGSIHIPTVDVAESLVYPCAQHDPRGGSHSTGHRRQRHRDVQPESIRKLRAAVSFLKKKLIHNIQQAQNASRTRPKTTLHPSLLHAALFYSKGSSHDNTSKYSEATTFVGLLYRSTSAHIQT